MAGRDLGMNAGDPAAPGAALPDPQSGPAVPAAPGARAGTGRRPLDGPAAHAAPGAPAGAAPVGPAVFARLKLRLVAGNLRGDTARLLGFILTLVLALLVASGGFTVMALLGAAPVRTALDVVTVLFTAMLVGWVVVPLLAFGLDDTLDPSRLALFPLTTARLAAGMFTSSVTGVWPVALLIVMFGAVAGLARGPGGLLLGAVAVLLLFALCVVTSRLVTTALSGVLRTRRGRDVLAVSVIFFILAAQLPNLLLNNGLTGDPVRMLHDVASVLRWTPPGMAAHALADGGLVALTEVLFLAALAVAVGLLWIAALRRAMVTADASTQAAASVRNSRGLVARLLPDGPLAAVVVKELKYARRDPRGRVGWFAALAITGVMAFSLNGDAGATPGPVLAIAPACLGALMIGLQSCNSFGIDGRSLWMNAMVYGTARAWRTDLAGRYLAVAVIAVPALAVLSVVAGLLAGDVLWAVPAVLTAWGVLGVGLGAGAVTSVLLPYTVPERLNAFTGAAPGQGGLAFAGSFGAMIGTAVLALPVVLPVMLGLTWISALAVPYGVLAAMGGRRLAGRLGFDRHPEILGAISHQT
ncbi:transporter [Planomonospora alba]|uniref:Transporter n=1 Tax=Planomonospora alba TaxID=161354 RepID=A0ABP6MJD5_9ACTN